MRLLLILLALFALANSETFTLNATSDFTSDYLTTLRKA